MRIDNSSPREVEQPNKAQERSAPASPGQADVSSAASTHAASPELNALREAVRNLPVVRPDLVAEISRRLRLGELSNGQAIERTARALTASSENATPPKSSSTSFPLTDLVAAIGVLPLTREGRITEASRKLRTGEVSSAEAIRATASVLLK